MADTSFDNLCKALDIEESITETYTKASNDCGHGAGREVFEYLADQQKAELARVRKIHEKLSAGETWAGACVLDEEDMDDAKALVAQMAKKYDAPTACTDELAALNTALDMNQKAISFYENWLKNESGDTAKRFVDMMVQEKRAHHLMLTDAQYYYEDPAGWAQEADERLLDGA